MKNKHSFIGLLAVAVIALLVGVWIGSEKDNALVEFTSKVSNLGQETELMEKDDGAMEKMEGGDTMMMERDESSA